MYALTLGSPCFGVVFTLEESLSKGNDVLPEGRYVAGGEVERRI